MLHRPPNSPPTDTPLPDPTLFRSPPILHPLHRFVNCEQDERRQPVDDLSHRLTVTDPEFLDSRKPIRQSGKVCYQYLQVGPKQCTWRPGTAPIADATDELPERSLAGLQPSEDLFSRRGDQIGRAHV